jgi:prepilin-type N-terminal cleavage/methylation domain-containing protein
MALAHHPGAMFTQLHVRPCIVRGRDGFTLVEVMIVCAIIAIVTMMSAPAYIQWTARYEMRQAVTELANNLSLARVAAKHRNAIVSVNLAVVSGHVNIQSGGLFPPVVLPRSIVAFSGGPIQFTQMGLSNAAANQTFTLTSDQNITYSVVVTPAGKVNWCPKAACP